MDESDLKAWRAGKPEGLQDSPSGVLSAMFSPDGRWIAYTSDGDVYVRPFRGHGGPWMVSAGGGSWPTWSPKRNELFYGTPENKIMVVPYLVDGDAFSAGKAMLWSPTGYVSGGAGRPFDLDPIDQRFAVKPIEQRADETHDKVVFIFNFFEELRRVAPATKG